MRLLGQRQHLGAPTGRPAHRGAAAAAAPPPPPGTRPAKQRRLGRAPCRAAAAAAAAVDAPPARWDSAVELREGKRLQVQAAPLAANTVALRCLDWDRDRFDIEFGLQNGTTYNSYLIFGADKVALVDASHEKFRSLYMPALAAQLAAAGRPSIDYVFCSHTEPDHSGLIADVLAAHPGATVVGSKVCLSFLDNLMHMEYKKQAVKGGDVIDLGGGHALEFVMAPNLHWPDTMFSFDAATRVLYTCDAFGMHYCSADPFDSALRPLEHHFRFYYDCLMRPNAKSVTTALRKVKDLPFEAVAVGHGPVLVHNVRELVGRYRDWSEAVGKAPTSVLVAYAADYGYSDRLSQVLARGVTKAGVATECADLLSVDPQELVALAGRSAGVVLMAPPSGAPEARAALATLLSAVKPGARVLIAESFGGADEPVDVLRRAFAEAGGDAGAGGALVAEPLRLRAPPGEAEYQLFEEAGTDLAQALTQKEKVAALKGAMPAEVAKALARVSGGLYIVTAAHAGARSAMVASWVAQASFEPPGLTIAVAKDRAIESLMQVGDSFALNCLGEDRAGAVMKHFLQRFPAGADRFEGVEWAPAPCGAPALADAIAVVECRVASRMETADHWVTYAEVTGGAVPQPEARTAVHRRKVANYY